MKNSTLTLILGLFNLGLMAQNQISSICFETELSNKIRVTNDLDVETLSFIDKLKFVEKRCDSQRTDYFDEQGNLEMSKKIIAQENFFPDWYVGPTETIMNETGTISYYGTENELLPGGWLGGSPGNHPDIIYGIDNLGNKYSEILYDDMELIDYMERKVNVQNLGLVSNYSFQYPSLKELANLQSMGYNTVSNDEIVRMSTPEFSIEWNLLKKTMTQSYSSGDNPDFVFTSYYEYNAIFNDFLVTQEVSTEPLYFNNGNCYEAVETKKYSNFNYNCLESSIGNRSDENESLANENIVLFPNPVVDMLSVEFPISKESTLLEIYDMNGSLITRDIINSETTFAQLSVSGLSRGLYIVKVQQGPNVYSTKFTKI